MMRSLDCRKVTADLWEYNVGLDSDALPLITTRALAVCGVDLETGEELFNLRSIRLDIKEASHRAHLAIAMAGKFRADSRVYEVALDGGHVEINGSPVVDKPIVFEHSSGPLAIKIGSMYTFSPFRLDISLEGSVIEWHGTSGHLETWTRSEVLDVESAESAHY